jgi:hypothetical protein
MSRIARIWLMLVCGFAVIPLLVIAIGLLAQLKFSFILDDIIDVGVLGSLCSLPVSVVWRVVLACRKAPSKDSPPLTIALTVAFLIVVMFGGRERSIRVHSARSSRWQRADQTLEPTLGAVVPLAFKTMNPSRTLLSCTRRPGLSRGSSLM